MIKKCFTIFIALIIFSVALCSCFNDKSESNNTTNNNESVSINTSELDLTFTDRDKSASYDDSSITKIALSDGATTYSGTGVSIENDSVKITQSGTYVFTGSLSNGSITVAAADDDKVQIVLENATITNNEGTAIYIKSCKNAFITAEQDSQNFISDGSDYTLTDDSSTLDAAIFSKCDLTVNGSGSLTVAGNFKHGIVSKDDLVLSNLALTINAKNVALNGKDCVKIESGSYILNAGSDGIRSDNTEDATKGYVYIENGSFEINVENDGIQAETLLQIDDCEMTITTGGGSINASTKNDGSFNKNWGFGGFNDSSTNQSDSTSDSESAKGLKSTANIIINNGNITVDSADDSLHANSTIDINNGFLTFTSGDDGIHADDTLNINDGTLTILKSYEGIEATNINVNGGNINVTASDDGFNAAGGNDSSSTSERPGQNMFSGSTGTLVFSGGYIVVDADGDGLDSNGSLEINGGVILVSGPTNNGNGALDYTSTANITGGTLIALGASGMAQNFSSAENQAIFLTTFNSQSKNSALAVCDETGKVILSYSPEKQYECAVISSPDITTDGAYTIIGNAVVSNTDENGFTTNGVLESGDTLSTVTPTTNVYGSGGSMGGPGGSMGRPGGSMGGPGGSMGGPMGNKPDK